MGKTIWWYLHLPIWVCSPVKGRDMCYASKLSVRWSQAGIIYSSWDWAVTRYYCCCSTEMSELIGHPLPPGGGPEMVEAYHRPFLWYWDKWEWVLDGPVYILPNPPLWWGWLLNYNLRSHISNQHTNLFENNTKYNEYQSCNLMASV